MRIFYRCQRCTACCRWPGEVRLGNAEISRLAAFLGMPEYRFVQEYTRISRGRHQLALQDKPNGECIFLDGRDCRVHSVKPDQCREFPSGWRFPGFERLCQAIPEQIEGSRQPDLERLSPDPTHLRKVPLVCDVPRPA